MSDYAKILVAVDLSEDSNLIVQRARAVASGASADLHIIHVIEPLSFAYGGDIPMDFSGIQDEIYQQAVMRATSKYNAVGRKYEQEECDERANVCSMADAVLADFKSAERDLPYMDEALEHLEFCAEMVCEQEIEEILNGPSYGPVR